MSISPLVIKVGGNDLAKLGFIEGLAEAVARLAQSQPCILIHGGGRTVDVLLDRLHIEPQYVDGQRVTDEATLTVVEMVLTGQVNKQLVRALLDAGVDAIGLSGVDRGLLRVEAWSAALGRVGRITSVRGEVLTELCEKGVIPVISPISLGPEGSYNVNADHAAGAIAAAVKAHSATFVSNVPGVLMDGLVAPKLTSGDIKRLIAENVINGGMIPKVNAALDALQSGVNAVVITDLDGLCNGTGTKIVA